MAVTADIALTLALEASLAIDATGAVEKATVLELLELNAAGPTGSPSNFLRTERVTIPVGGSTVLAFAGLDSLGRSLASVRSIRLALFKNCNPSARAGVRIAMTSTGESRWPFGDSADQGGLTVAPGGLIVLLAPNDKGYDVAVSPTCDGFELYSCDDEAQSQEVDIILVGVGTFA